jgi:diadenosine tetraphosphate (Ap4A) HIT family hydrolase
LDGCPFCEASGEVAEAIVARNEHCLLVRFEDPVLESWLMILPVRHAETPFDLTAEEWAATRELLGEAKRVLAPERPDGYSVGWNVHPVGGQSIPHAHLHVIGRYADEPLAGQGIRHALRQPANRRWSRDARAPTGGSGR